MSRTENRTFSQLAIFMKFFYLTNSVSLFVRAMRTTAKLWQICELQLSGYQRSKETKKMC